MTSQPSTESGRPSLAHVILPAASPLAPDEFMDLDGKYTFRSYLTPTASAAEAAVIVSQALSSISSHQRDLSNEQLYDELHATLCGPEPMEREQLLRFMEFFVQSVFLLIDRTAEAALPTLRSKPMDEADTCPANDEKCELASLTGASKFPQQSRCFLKAIELVTGESPKSGLIFKLSILAGCSDLEISRIVDTTVEKVNSRRLAVITSIWQAYDNLLQSCGVKQPESEFLS